MLLNSTKDTLQDSFQELDPEHISMLYMKAQEHQNRKKFFFDIRDRAIVVEHAARDVAHEVEEANAAGKLKETTHEGHTFWIEDPENGNGLSIFKNKKNEYMLCRRRNWKAHGFPGRYTNDQGNSFYIMAYGLFARMGAYVFYSEQRQEIHYCSKSETGNAVYKIVCHGKQGQMSFEATKLINDFYEADGETIIIENDMIEYKKYFKAGKEVDWAEFKKNRPQDRLDFEMLETVLQDAQIKCNRREATQAWKDIKQSAEEF